ncbi:porin family protein [Balneola vulgaris]|uniref:porin family protein n=1 Tax=Balneola vulgaris TaxID=287535 RepID=UPI00036FA69F|nr:porin family protein [Balneola vulgaris]
MKFLLSTIACAMLFAFSNVAHAQTNPLKDKSGIGPKIGYYKAPDADDGTMFVGFQSRSRGDVFGFEFAAEYRGEQSYTVSGSEVTTRQIPITASLLMFVPVAPNFQPYGLAGLGAYYTFYDYEGGLNNGDDADFNIGYHLGFGADLPLSNSAALNVDYRYLFLDGPDDSLGDKEFSGNVISAGLTFYF